MSRPAAAADFLWIDLLLYAEERANCRSQLMRRLVINRAYYAAFHMARQTLRSISLPRATTQFHRQVWGELRTASAAAPAHITAWRTIADIGTDLHGERVRADYDSTAWWSHDECLTIVAKARDVVNRLAALPSR